jgi:mRNA interferase MazF
VRPRRRPTGTRQDYVPERGDAVWLDFNPQAGHEQAGQRPAVVLSPASYNGKVGLALICPVTNQVKGYPFEVALPAGFVVTGVVLADQVKSLDWRARGIRFQGKLPASLVQDVLDRTMTLLSRDDEQPSTAPSSI